MIPIDPPAPLNGDAPGINQMIRQHGRSLAEKPALICGGQTLSWAVLNSRINKVASLLLDLGLEKGDRVTILSPNSLAYAELFLGILRAGGCVTPLSSMASTEALRKMILDCRAVAHFQAEAYRHLTDDFIDQIPLARFGLDFDAPAYRPYEAAMQSAQDRDPEIPVDPTDPFNLIYSSGTTGTPKGILHAHAMRNAQMERVRPNGYDANARTLISTPLYSNTTIVAFLPTLYGGSTVYLMPKFEARDWLALAEAERITHTMLVPVQYKRLMAVADFDRFDLSAMRIKFSTSAPLRADLKADVLARFPGKLVEYYGLTEGGGVTVLVADEYPDKLHTVGKPAPNCDIRIIGDQGQQLAPGEIGEICGRSPTMMTGYFGRDDVTESNLWRDAAGRVFLRSGDMGRFDPDGFLILSDRKKDMIISGGLNIFADDLERVLLADPDVADAAVIGIPSERWGETPLGLIVRRDGATRGAAEILADTNASLGKSQRLSRLELRDMLPRSTIGKILKRDLRAPYWQEAGEKKERAQQ